VAQPCRLFIGRADCFGGNASSTNLDPPCRDPDLWRLNLFHSLDGRHGATNQRIGFKLYTVSRLGLDPIP
jgi:hypothetical protein